MRLSVLLPTRNGGAYLPGCIRSILEEDDDFELVVSDNANTDTTKEVLAEAAGDERVRVVTTDDVVGVVENWNRAYVASTGDHVLMMGDDDLLRPGYVRWLLDVLERNDEPDCVLYNAYTYVAPSAIGGLAVSHYAERHFRYGPELPSGSRLPADVRRSIVVDMFRFRPRIPLNMQTTVVARRAAAATFGPTPFRAPFPDHLLLNALLLSSDRWLFVDERPLIVGVSPKSFGHFVYSNDHSAGTRYLGIDTSFPGRLPGNELLNGTHAWLDQLLEAFPDELEGIAVSRRDYVGRQLWAWFQQWRDGELPSREALRRLRLLDGADVASLVTSAADPHLMRKAWSRLPRHRVERAAHVWEGLHPIPEVSSIEEFARWLDRRGIAP